MVGSWAVSLETASAPAQPWIWLPVVAVLLLALALRPWRALPPSGLPWVWLAWWATLPLWWSVDRLAGIPLIQPLSGVPLLVLMAGWPLAMLMLPAVALVQWLGGMGAADALARLWWLGMLPGTLALLLGLAIRRWVPIHLFVYILGRGFIGSAIAVTLAGAAALAAAPPMVSEAGDLMLARLLSASGEAFLTGMFTSIFVAFRPEWLSTYADRIYLKLGPPP